MKTAFLHVGLPKTGTTSIQDFLFEEREALETAGFLFPAPASATREARVAAGEGWGRHASILAAVQGDWGSLAPGEWDAWQTEFARFARSATLHTLIISHETIGNRAAQLDMTLLRNVIDGHRQKVLLVVREAEAWLTSLYEQRISGRRRMSAAPEAFGSVHDYLRGGFETRIKALQSAFPDAEILVVPFERLVAGHGLVPNSAALIGLPADVQARGETAKRVNISLTQERIEVMRRCNGSDLPFESFVAIRRALAAAQRRSEQPKAPRRRIFPPEIAAAIAARYEDDRAWLARTLGVDLPPQKVLAPEPLALGAAELADIVEQTRPFLTPEIHAQFARAATAPEASRLPTGRERAQAERRRLRREQRSR